MPRAEAPIACTLRPGALAERLAWIRQVTDRSLLSHRREGAVLHLVYTRDAMQELAQIVDGERDCCSFLEFELREAAEGVALSIRDAPDVGGVEARRLFEQFLPHAVPRRGCGCAPGACQSP